MKSLLSLAALWVLLPTSALAFVCGSGEFIYDYWGCDGWVDCDDGSDEEGCEPAEEETTFCDVYASVCGDWTGETPCADWWAAAALGELGDASGATQGCYLYHLDVASLQTNANAVAMHCAHAAGQADSDGNAPCTDGPVEEEEVGDGWYCDDGEIIDPSYVCDDYEDCSDGSDEANCEEPEGGEEAGEEVSAVWYCDDGAEIDPSSVCDGIYDCWDGSDEYGCGESWEEEGGEFTDVWYCDDGEEIDAAWVCDGGEDCSDGSDESYCDEGDELYEVWYCDDGGEIDPSWVNDGICDCADGSDEPEGGCEGDEISWEEEGEEYSEEEGDESNWEEGGELALEGGESSIEEGGEASSGDGGGSSDEGGSAGGGLPEPIASDEEESTPTGDDESDDEAELEPEAVLETGSDSDDDDGLLGLGFMGCSSSNGNGSFMWILLGLLVCLTGRTRREAV